MLFDDRVDMRDLLMRIAGFFRDESCGQCVPCRVGCEKLVEIGHDLQNGRYDGVGADPAEQMVGDLRGAMEQASICGLGMVGANPLATVFQHFRDDLEPYVRANRATGTGTFATIRPKPNGEPRR